jgi:hypothetical protein
MSFFGETRLMKSVGTRFFLLRTGLALGLSLVVPAFMGVGCECPEPDPPAPGEGEGEGEEGEGEGPAPVAALSIDPTVQNFGDVVVGDSSDGSTFTVSNSGDAGSQTGTISVTSGGDFAIDASTCGASLGQGETCTVTVIFSPGAEGVRSGNVTATAGDLTASAALSGTGTGPADISINPDTADFGDVVAGSSSASQTFTVSNDGDGDTGTLAVTLGGANAGQFSVDADTCDGTSLAAGASCDITVTFSPTDAGNAAATLTVDGDGTDPVSASLSGTGLDDADLNVSPTARNFGTVTLGAASAELDFTITNTGDVDSGALTETLSGADAAEFEISASGCDGTVLAPNASCTVSVTFRPTGATAGPRTATLEVEGAPGGTITAALSGDAVEIGNLEIDPTANDFGDQTLNTTSASATFTIENTGGSATGTLSAVISGTGADQFPVVSGGNGCQGVSLPAGGTCTVAVTFRPTTAGDKLASLTVTDSASGDIAIAALSGNGLGDAIFQTAPTGIDFGSVATGSNSGTANVVVRNIGQVDSSVPTVTISGANFSQFTIVANGCTAALAPNGTCTVTVRYNPTAEALHAATLTVSGALGGTATTQLAGTGISPSQLVFVVGGMADSAVAGGSVVIDGDSGVDTITIRNDGDETSGVISTVLIGPNGNQFEITTENCNTLATGATCTVTGRFSPNGAAGTGGAKLAQLQVSATPGGTITSQDWTGNALEKLLRTDIAVPAQTSTHNFGNVRLGSAAANQVMVFTQTVGTGAANSQNLTVTKTGANAADFDIVADTCTNDNLVPGDTCSVTVGFSPVGDPSQRNAVLTVRNATTDSTAVVNLTGNAQGALQVACDDNDDGNLDVTDPDGAGPFASELDDSTNVFPNTVAGTASAPRSCFFINTSATATGPLSTSLTGGQNFIVLSDSCTGASLGASDGVADGDTDAGEADMCEVVLWFSPRTATSGLSGSITVTAAPGTAGNSAAATLTGNGVTNADIELNPATQDFGAVLEATNVAGNNRTFTVTNVGQVNSSPISFSLLDGDSFDIQNLAAGTTCVSGTTIIGTGAGTVASCNIVVRFAPDAGSANTQAIQDILEVTAATGGTDTSTLSGTSVSQLSIAPATFNFGNDTIDGTVSTTIGNFVVTNSGSATTTTSALVPSISGGQFTLENSGATDCVGVALAPGANCTVRVRFNATTRGVQTGSVTVEGVNGEVTATAALSGNGQTEATLDVDGFDDHDFGSILLGAASATKTFTVRNVGDVTTSAITVTNGNPADFDIVTNNCTAPLAANATCTIVTAFSPVSAGARTSTVLLTIDGPGDEDIILNGDGETAADELTIAPSFHDFGSAQFGTNSANQTFTVTNTSGAQALDLVIATTAEFTFIPTGTAGAGTCGTGGTFDLAAGGTCTVVARFSPTATQGDVFGDLTVTEAAGSGGSSARAALHGFGQAPSLLDLTGPTSNVTEDFGDVGFGQSSGPRTFTLVNTGDVATGALSGPVLSGTGAALWSIGANTCTGTLAANDGVAGGADQCTFTLAFNPTATGPRTATVTMTSEQGAVDDTESVNLVGNGLNPPVISVSPNGAFAFASTAVTAQTNPGRVYTVSNDVQAADTGPLSITNTNNTDFTTMSPTAGFETEPNDDGSASDNGGFFGDDFAIANADGPINANGDFLGSMDVDGDEDVFAVTNIGPETDIDFAVDSGNCATEDTMIIVRDAAGNILDFNDDAVGLCSRLTFTIAHRQTVFAQIKSFSDAQTFDYTLSVDGLGASLSTCQNGTVLEDGDDCDVEVRFTPVGPPAAETNTTTISASPGGTVNLSQTGTSTSQLSAVVTNNFVPAPDGDASVDIDISDLESEDGVVTVTNNGAIPTGVISVTLTKGTEFSIISNDCSASFQILGPNGDTCTIGVRYRPTTAGTDTATVTVSATPGDLATADLTATSIP